MGAGKTLDVSALPSLNTSIASATDYSQLGVVGDLSIAGKALNLSGSYTPVAGDVFTIVNATNLTGTFTGLANGSTTTFNGRTLLVNYTSTTATLTDPAPLVTTQPNNANVLPGATASFTAAASGSPTPTVRWQVSTNGGVDWTDISGATSTTYSFSATSADNAKRYRAVFTNTYGTANSSAASLTVNEAPAITTQPTNQTAAPGSTATFTAAASGTPTPTVKWQVNTGSGFSDIAGATSTTYTTGTLSSAENGYQYRAIFTNGIGSDATSNSASLTVNSDNIAPSITSHPSNTTVNSGSTASFSAAASGSPTPTVKWQVSTNGGTNWTDISGATSTTYSFTTAAGDNGTQYRAVFTNGVGSDATTNAATLTVNYAPSVTSQPTNQTATVGGTATFTAAATGNPTPTVKWQNNSGSGWADIAGATSNSYTTGVLASGDNGTQYRAIYTNGVGSDATTNAATLTVNYAPSVTQNPSSSTVTPGDTASFTAAAIGNPTPTVQWQVSTNGGSNWSDISNATNTSYSFTAASGDNGNQYRAVFTNSVASTNSTSATLNVSSPSAPSITAHPTNTGVEAGQDGKLYRSSEWESHA
jgi:hypothetical protein